MTKEMNTGNECRGCVERGLQHRQQGDCVRQSGLDNKAEPWKTLAPCEVTITNVGLRERVGLLCDVLPHQHHQLQDCDVIKINLKLS